MPVTYTIISADVSSVAPSSRLTEGVQFDWTNQKIYVPSSVGQVTAQWVIDNCRFVESLPIGLAKPKIVDGGGKVQIGVDPETDAPITTPTIAIFQGEWKLVTQKASGVFVVKDVYMRQGAASPIPYDDVVNVFIQYLTSVSGAVATVTSGSGLDAAQNTKLSELHAALETSGVFSTASLANAPAGEGGGLTPAQIWQYGDRTLTSAANLVLTKGAHITGFNDLSLATIEDSTVLAKQSTVLSVHAALASVPTNPLLTTDSRLSNLGTIDTIYSLLGFKPGDSLTASQTQHTTASGKRVLISLASDGTTTLTRSDP